MLYICSVIENKVKMKWSELRRIAEKNGWFLVRHGSRHDVYGHRDKGFRIEIGRHDKEEIRNGTFNKLKGTVTIFITET